MRTLILTLLLLVVAAVPLQAQTCGDEAAPPLSALFPDEIAGLERELYDTRDGCFTYLYKPTEFKPAEGTGGPWAVVMVEPHSDPFLGDTPGPLLKHYESAGAEVYDMNGWPVTKSLSAAGEEFVTLKDDLRVAVVVKDSTDPEASLALARSFFEALLPKVSVRCSG